MAKFDVVQAWLDNVAYSHSKSVNTEREYRFNLNRFCEFVGKTPEQILEEYEASTDREFRRKYARYVRALISQLMNKGYSPSTVVNSATTVKSFFKYNDLPLGHVPVGRRHIVFHNRDITAEEIAEILKVSRPRDRAFYCMMAQSGLRPDTLCKLKLKHVQPLQNIIKGKSCKIEIPEDISKGAFGAYFTFMGEESVKYLRSYLLKKPNIGPEDYLFTSHGSDKQLNTKSISGIFVRSLENLKESGKIDFEQMQIGKPRNVRLYNLRKFFRKQAGQAGIEYVNFWMGHKTDYKAPHIPASDMHYFDTKDVEFQRQLYEEKAMPHLRLLTPTATETDKIIEQQSGQIKSLREQVEMLTNTLYLVAQGRVKAGTTNINGKEVPAFIFKDKDVIEALHVTPETLAKAKEKLREMAKKKSES